MARRWDASVPGDPTARSRRARPGRAGVRPVGPEPVGVARALSKLGHCSRTRAELLVRAGRVEVDGVTVADPEHRVDLAGSRLSVDGERVLPAPPLYLALNKPRGLVTTAEDERGRETVYRCLPPGLPWVAPVGRLDRASEGLLLFTNDTGWAARLLDPRAHVRKTYHVQVDRVVDAGLLRQVTAGVTTDRGDRLCALGARRLRQGTRTSWIEVTLDEGRNRHIRRLLEALGVRVLRLVRVAIGPLALGDLAKGQVRPLTPAEKAALEGPARREREARGVPRAGLPSPAPPACDGSPRRRSGPGPR